MSMLPTDNSMTRSSTGNHFRPKSAPLKLQIGPEKASSKLSTINFSDQGSSIGVNNSSSAGGAGSSGLTRGSTASERSSKGFLRPSSAVLRGQTQQKTAYERSLSPIAQAALSEKPAVWGASSQRQPVLTRPRSAQVRPKGALGGNSKVSVTGEGEQCKEHGADENKNQTQIAFSSTRVKSPPPSAARSIFGGSELDAGATMDNDAVVESSESTTTTSATLRPRQKEDSELSTLTKEEKEDIKSDPLFRSIESANTNAQRSSLYRRLMGRESASNFVAVAELEGKRPTSAFTSRSAAKSSMMNEPLSTTFGTASNHSSTGLFEGGTKKGLDSKVRGFSDHQNAVTIERRLIEALAALEGGDEREFERVQAHRLAFDEYIQTVPLQAQSLLRRIYVTYENVVLHEYKSSFDHLFGRLKLSETHASDLRKEIKAYQVKMESLKLDVSNLEREVNIRNEMLSQISSTYKINVGSVNWITGVESKLGQQRTMAEIRTVQKRVTTAYGEAQRAAARGEEEEELAQQRRETEAQQMAQQREMEQADELIGQGLDKGFTKDGKTGPYGAPNRKSELQKLQERSHRSTDSASPEGGTSDTNIDVSMSATLTLEEQEKINKTQEAADLYRNSQRIENVGVDLEAEAENPEKNYGQPKHGRDVHPE